MGIAMPAPPSIVEQTAEASLRHLSSRAIVQSTKSERIAKGPFQLADTLEVFCLGLLNVTTDSNLEAAMAIAWRFFVVSGDSPVAITEVVVGKRLEKPYWSHMSYDSRLRTHLSVIRRIRIDPRFQTRNYELRFLRIPSLDLNALLWLKGAEGLQDILIPMASIPFLRPGWHYSVPKLFDSVRKPAQRRLAATNAPPENNLDLMNAESLS
jgi:hypothetical protein